MGSSSDCAALEAALILFTAENPTFEKIANKYREILNTRAIGLEGDKDPETSVARGEIRHLVKEGEKGADKTGK